jgi:hypothetical protein
MTFFFFSARLFETDFRRSLIKALKAKGHDVWHIRIGRTIVVTRSGGDGVEFYGILGFYRLIRYLRAHIAGKVDCVFLDSTGACVAFRSVLLRAAFRGLWCFDIYDDFLYDLSGLRRLERRLAIFALSSLSSIRIVLSQETLRLFPRAYHLDNAAHTRRIARDRSNLRDLVILFYIDNRFDFELVGDVAALIPQARLYLYGRIHPGDENLKRRMDKLCAEHDNLIYRGEYRFDDVDEIIAHFGIGFMPYVTNNVLTEFINPDKYYLFLNGGLEVISTDIPQANRLKERIHIVHSSTEVVAIATRLQSDSSYGKNKETDQCFSWEQRADELMEIIQSQTTSGHVVPDASPSVSSK